MGVPHLEKLREFMEKNKDQAFSRTVLRDTLKQNFSTIQMNLDYLIETEGVVFMRMDKVFGKICEVYQWKEKKGVIRE